MNLKTIIYLLFAFCISVFAQSGKSLAVIDGKQLTTEEFAKRFELSPFLSQSLESKTIKEEFLLTLIAEKILAFEAKKANLELHPELKLKLNSLRKKYTRDRLFINEVENKINISRDEIEPAIFKASRKLYCNFIVAGSEEEITQLNAKLNSGIEFDSLLAGRDEKTLQSEPIPVEFGQMNEELENIIFTLAPGTCSPPVNTEKGWVIYSVKNIVTTAPDLSDDKFKKKIRDVLKDRKLSASYREYMSVLMKGIEVKADSELFYSLEKKISEILPGVIDDKGAELSFDQLQSIKANYGREILNRYFVKFDVMPITFGAFLDELSADGLIIRNGENPRTVLDNYTRDFIRYEILFREAQKYNIDKSADVLEELQIWKENYLASLARKKIVSDLRENNNKTYSEDGRELFEDLSIEIARLASLHKIDIDWKLLGTLNVNPMKVLVYKLYGFGGRGAAVPAVSNFHEWFEIMRNLPKEIN